MAKNIVLILLTVFISGCGRIGAKTLTVAMSLGEAEWKVMREEVFPLFEKKHHIKINAYQIESGQLATKLEALAEAGRSEIDLFAQDNMSLARLVNKKLILDLSEYKEIIPAQVLSNIKNACRFNGRLMFMPFRPNVQIVYYNDEAFTKYNLHLPQDWDELLEVAKKFKDKEGEGRILIKAFGGNSTATQIYEFILQAGGDPYEFDDEGCIRTFEFLQELWPYVSPESKRAKWDTTNGILARRQAYLAQNWPFGISILIHKYHLEFIKTYSGWQGPAGRRHVIGGDVFGIPRNAENVEGALDFIGFMQSKPVQEILLSKLGWPSVREDAYTKVPEWQRMHYRSIRQALENGVFRKNVIWWPAYAKFVSEAFRQIVIEGKAVRPTLAKYKDSLEKQKNLYK